MIILGIDPGLRKTGYGVIEKKGNTYRLLESGIIKLEKIPDLHDRLLSLYLAIENILSKYRPSCISIEKAFVGRNAKSAFMIGEARAVCILAAKKQSIPVFEYATRSVKQGLTGFGSSEKANVKKMVKLVLGVNDDLKDDASDALALAIFHGNIDYARGI